MSDWSGFASPVVVVLPVVVIIIDVGIAAGADHTLDVVALVEDTTGNVKFDHWVTRNGGLPTNADVSSPSDQSCGEVTTNA